MPVCMSVTPGLRREGGGEPGPRAHLAALAVRIDFFHLSDHPVALVENYTPRTGRVRLSRGGAWERNVLGGSSAEAGVGHVVNRCPLTSLPCPQRPVCPHAVTVERNDSEGLGAALLLVLV